MKYAEKLSDKLEKESRSGINEARRHNSRAVDLCAGMRFYFFMPPGPSRAAFFLAAHPAFIMSESFLRPAGVKMTAGLRFPEVFSSDTQPRSGRQTPMGILPRRWLLPIRPATQ